jgi:site-specific recombinase XerD
MEVVMIEQYFVKPSTIDRIHASWLAPQIESYVAWLHDRGYAAPNVLRRVPILCQFANFAQRIGVTEVASSISLIEEFASSWLAEHGIHCKTAEARRKVAEDARNPVRQMLRLALEGRVSAARNHRLFPFQAEAPGFIRYLEEERGLREGTVYHYSHHLNRFQDFLQQAGVGALGEISTVLLASFVVRCAPGMARTSRRDLCGALRVFLRFCFRERIIAEDLSAAVEMPQQYRLADVPRSITWDEVRRLLAVVDRRTVRGRRDYAILLLLVTYGLRAHEIAKLTLDDIDWKRERLQVPERKAGHWTAYPLASVVAEAIIEYLQNGRPETTDRHLFFRALAPRAPIGKGSVSSSVAEYLQNAGIKVHKAGAHTLRHTCVQRLIDAEFPLKTIGDYVGHRSPQSTEIYTKVAIASLREVAMGDGEAL